ncbi:MAG: hypothetical protein ACXVCP_03845 [Bdellovibrio sp.]
MLEKSFLRPFYIWSILAIYLFSCLSCVDAHIDNIETGSMNEIGSQSFASTSVQKSSAGWNTPINIPDQPIYSAPLGLANSPISGTTIESMITNPAVTVRPDGNSCISCHGGTGSLRPEWDAQTMTQTQYCDLVTSFVAAKKPQILKDVFAQWLADGCPK